MSETTKCGTGCITPSVCHAFFCNRVVQDKVLPSPHPATPPTPDLDAVVARVRGTWMAMMQGHSDAAPFFVIRNDNAKKFADDLLALLAAVSRPAEARGDDAVLRETLAEALDYAPSSQLAYLALAAGAGQTLDLNKIVDALLAAAPRPETGEVSEAMVEAYRDADMCADSLLDTHTAHWCPKCIASGLRAALAAQREQRP